MSDRNSGTVQREIEVLVLEYQALVKTELKDVPGTRELLVIARSKSSCWSGGNSVANMLEQIVQGAALDRLDRLDWLERKIGS